MDFEIRSSDQYILDSETRWHLQRLAETINLANRIPSNINIPDRTYKAFISLINDELWRVESQIKEIEKHPHTANSLSK